MPAESATSADGWSDLASRRFAALRIDAAAPDFTGSIRTRRLGSEVGLAAVTADAVEMTRTSRLAAAAEDDAVFLSVQRHGPFRVEQRDRSARVVAGEAVLYRADEPFHLVCEERTSCLTLRLSAGAVAVGRRRIADVVARPIATQTPELRVLTAFLRTVEQNCDDLDEEQAGRMGHIGLALVDALLGALGGEDPRPTERMVTAERMRVFLLDHLDDPDLSLTRIAEHFRVSTRTVTATFAAAGLPSPVAYIRSRRIERARRLLDVPGTGLAEIAARVGFDSAATLTRVFKRLTGTTPSDWRRERAQLLVPEST